MSDGYPFVFEVGLLLLKDCLYVSLELSELVCVIFFLLSYLCLVRFAFFLELFDVTDSYFFAVIVMLDLGCDEKAFVVILACLLGFFGEFSKNVTVRPRCRVVSKSGFVFSRRSGWYR